LKITCLFTKENVIIVNKVGEIIIMRFRYILFILLISTGIFAQNTKAPIQLQEVSDADGIPVMIKHLPAWETVQSNAKLINNINDLRKIFPNNNLLELVKFAGGTEGVTADYEQGKLLIVEFTNPQLATESDEKFKQFLTATPQSPQVFYRRIGNYATFVFNAPNEETANGLLGQIKYEKVVQWLGEDPYWYARAERAYLNTTGDMLLSTVIAVVGGISGAILVGCGVGCFVFYLRKKRRGDAFAFSDAGGMTRLNLDELSDGIPSKLLGE
jgi:hypothetical protein